MIAIDEDKRELVVGIIDCIRTYTLDKKLESWIKDRGLAGGGRNRPTITSPKEYKSRFREAMARYVFVPSPPDFWVALVEMLTDTPPGTSYKLRIAGTSLAGLCLLVVCGRDSRSLSEGPITMKSRLQA